MRSTMLGIAAVMVAASPVMADGLPVAPYTAGPTYQREVHTYEARVSDHSTRRCGGSTRG